MRRIKYSFKKIFIFWNWNTYANIRGKYLIIFNKLFSFHKCKAGSIQHDRISCFLVSMNGPRVYIPMDINSIRDWDFWLILPMSEINSRISIILGKPSFILKMDCNCEVPNIPYLQNISMKNSLNVDVLILSAKCDPKLVRPFELVIDISNRGLHMYDHALFIFTWVLKMPPKIWKYSSHFLLILLNCFHL